MLCDRLGIFVDGQLVCIGNPKEITSRYGGYLVRCRAPRGRGQGQLRARHGCGQRCSGSREQGGGSCAARLAWHWVAPPLPSPRPHITRVRPPPPQVFTITVPAGQEAAAADVVARMSPGARLTYSVGGTLKYELPAGEVSLAGVFERMEEAKGQLQVLDWAVANATLEEVFINLAREVGAKGGD